MRGLIANARMSVRTYKYDTGRDWGKTAMQAPGLALLLLQRRPGVSSKLGQSILMSYLSGHEERGRRSFDWRSRRRRSRAIRTSGPRSARPILQRRLQLWLLRRRLLGFVDVHSIFGRLGTFCPGLGIGDHVRRLRSEEVRPQRLRLSHAVRISWMHFESRGFGLDDAGRSRLEDRRRDRS